MLKLFQSQIISVLFEVEKRDIALNFASASVNLAIVVFQDLLCLHQAIESLIKLVARLLHLGQIDQDASDDVRVGELIDFVEDSECFRLVLNGLGYLLSLQVGTCQLEITVAYLFRLGALGILDDLQCLLNTLDCSVELLLAHADLPNNHQNLPVALILLPHDLLVHFVRLLQQRQCILVVASLHVAVTKHGQYVRVILLGGLNLCEQTTVQLQRCRQVVQRLFEVACSQVCLSQLGIGSHQKE